MNFPFKEEKIKENTFIRKFDQSVDLEDLVWHRDHEDRIVKSMINTNWKFQFDNELPISFEGEIFIPKGVYHRILKGDGDLFLEIIKVY